MYQYDALDKRFVKERVAQFRDQVARRLAGELSEEQFRPLRLMNGVYLQLHAYMLRVAIPYGTLSAAQLKQLAFIARAYDKGYGHFTTRQNIQFNWPKLEDLPDILEHLADVDMHAIQTSGNCIRNVTADQFAGAAADEVDDSRIWAELIRQWSTLHPEFSFLPRKFKIAVTAAKRDRAAVLVHDIGLRLYAAEDGGEVFEVAVGGGLGRTPMIGKVIRQRLAKADLLTYLEAILRVYNLQGRRDNKYKARIKILVHELGPEAFAAQVEAEFEALRGGPLALPADEIQRIRAHFSAPPWRNLDDDPKAHAQRRRGDPAFQPWLARNIQRHKAPGYAIVNVSLKATGQVPGDALAEQMEILALLAERYSFGEIRVTHEQNLVLAHVEQGELYVLYKALEAAGLASGNIGLISDIISCPGLDFCTLATARSIPLAQQISERFADPVRAQQVGDLSLNISGCINACGHHHVANIGILGVDKKGEEFYQITLGGRADEDAAIGKIIGPAFRFDDAADAVERIVEIYLAARNEGEAFLDTYTRLGPKPFKAALYD